jgi:c-di-GMP-binding flagellar brake protein YcgR
LFEALIDEKIIISMSVLGTNFEQLIVISALEQASSGDHLIIDPPSGFKNAVNGADSWKLRFKCKGPDKLKYSFITRGGTHCDQGIRVPLPEGVQRIQRRKDFRVDCFPNTLLQFNAKKQKGVMRLKNISMGGVFGDLVKYAQESANGPPLKNYQRLSKILITFPAYAEYAQHLVHIKKARVVRIDRDKDRHIHQFALQFMEIGRTQESALREAIYQIQRHYLQNR